MAHVVIGHANLSMIIFSLSIPYSIPHHSTLFPFLSLGNHPNVLTMHLCVIFSWKLNIILDLYVFNLHKLSYILHSVTCTLSDFLPICSLSWNTWVLSSPLQSRDKPRFYRPVAYTTGERGWWDKNAKIQMKIRYKSNNIKSDLKN